MRKTPVVSTMAAIAALVCAGAAQAQKTRDYTSKVPHYTFSDTLEEQLKELKTNPLLLRFHASRAKMAGDPHRPIYHYVNPEARLNDPNGLSFWQGRWHLFYQAYPPEDSRQHWGHAMSKDLKRQGFTFVGSTICYAFMQATGMMNDHLVGCFRYGEIESQAPNL